MCVQKLIFEKFIFYSIRKFWVLALRLLLNAFFISFLLYVYWESNNQPVNLKPAYCWLLLLLLSFFHLLVITRTKLHIVSILPIISHETRNYWKCIVLNFIVVAVCQSNNIILYVYTKSSTRASNETKIERQKLIEMCVCGV